MHIATKHYIMAIKTIVVLTILLLLGFSGITQENLKVMTFNVRYDEALFHKGESHPNHWANRKILQVELINKYQPDVIGMQEPHLHQIKYLDKQLQAYSWVGVGRADGKEKDEFNPIYYHSAKLTLMDFGTFWMSETPEEPSRSWDSGYDRICTWALFQNMTTKQRFYVFNTHFDSKGKIARLKSAELVNQKIKIIAGDKPVFVLGDFNFQPDSEPYAEITSKALADSQTISEKEPAGPEGTFNSFRVGANHKRRIDFIFVNKRVKVKNYKVIDFAKNDIYPSDHFPVLIEAKFKKIK